MSPLNEKKSSSKRRSCPSILSIGYEQRKTEAFLDTLAEYKIQALVDVRASAFSRRLDFRKNKLISLLAENGIEYFHLPNAGNPHRRSADNLQECLKMYRDYIAGEPFLLDEIANQLNQIFHSFPRIAVLCYEKCATECHRTILINLLLETEFECSLIEV